MFHCHNHNNVQNSELKKFCKIFLFTFHCIDTVNYYEIFVGDPFGIFAFLLILNSFEFYLRKVPMKDCVTEEGGRSRTFVEVLTNLKTNIKSYLDI